MRKDPNTPKNLLTEYFFSGAKLAVVFMITLLSLWLLLFLSALIPNEALRSNMVQSALTYQSRKPYEVTKENQLNSIADHYADTIWLNVAWNLGNGDPLTSTLRTNYYDGGEQGENIGLYQSVVEGMASNTDYTRYWHGTVIFIRLLHLFTDVEGVKLIGFVSLLLLILLTAVVLIKKRHWDLALWLLLSLTAVRAWNLRLSLEYQPAFLVAFGLMPLLLLLERKNDRYLLMLSVISGTAVSFFDFLTTETVTILLPLALVVAVRAKENRLGTFRENLLLLIKCGICWGLSYAGAFVVKWTAATLVTGTNAFAIALTSVAERFGSGVGNFGEPPDSFLSAPLANLNMLFGGPARINYGQIGMGCGLFLLMLLSMWYLLRGKKKQPHAAALLLFLGSLVLVRCLVLNNHSYLHCFFTHRALVTLVFSLLTSVWLNISLPQKKRRQK